ncbi:hypothetical protein SAMN05444673_4111 [Bacillus sp. OV166]|uniref:hypothetical protein n=1 Tax=Bacillus sp. OV166 TaxID=1882763 RepID=UPI000A2AED87|nr:hypothetical protein [Bacillus sp. OV166]SMQ81054.1 hypothetical protein SAMN05444673_4111 [Bacillus sp. OV166]
MKKINVIIFLFLFAFNPINMDVYAEESKSAEFRGDNLFINFVDDKLKQRFYQYDTNTKKNKILFKKEITDYPTATYSSSNKEVYFTNKTKNQTSQLFKQNLNNSQTKQLTNQFNNVDLLELDEENQLLFMRVLIGDNERNFQLAIYDLKNKKINKWNNQDKDTSVFMMDYNPKKKQLLLVTNSVKKEYEKIEQANKKGIPPEPPVYTLSIYNKDGQKVKDIKTIEVFLTGASLSSDGNNILISYFNNPKEHTFSIATIDMKSKNTTLLLKDPTVSMRQPEYNKDKSGFYFLADKNKQININDENVNEVTINFYEIKNKIISKTWFCKNGQVVNFYVDK